MDPMDPEKQANDAMDTQAAARKQQVASMVPPPEEPLDPGAATVLAETVERVAGVLTGGEVGGGPAPVFEEPLNELPPDLAAKVMTLSEFAGASGFEQYRIKPETLTTSKGLQDAAIRLDEMASDSEVLRATKQGPVAGRRVSPNGSKAEAGEEKVAGRRVSPNGSKTPDAAAEELVAGRRVSPNGSKTT